MFEQSSFSTKQLQSQSGVVVWWSVRVNICGSFLNSYHETMITDFHFVSLMMFQTSIWDSFESFEIQVLRQCSSYKVIPLNFFYIWLFYSLIKAKNLQRPRIVVLIRRIELLIRLHWMFSLLYNTMGKRTWCGRWRSPRCLVVTRMLQYSLTFIGSFLLQRVHVSTPIKPRPNDHGPELHPPREPITRPFG